MGFVSKVFSGLMGGDAPPMPSPAPAAPTMENSPSIDTRQQEERQRRLQAGRASTVLTGGMGLSTEPDSASASKKLLGA